MGRTPGLTSFNCTGVGDGELTCSGPIRATDVRIVGTSITVADLIGEVSALKAFVGMIPPSSPPTPSSPPSYMIGTQASPWGCPAGYSSIEDEVDCQLASAAIGSFYDASLIESHGGAS